MTDKEKDGINAEEFYKRYFPNMTEEQRAEFEAAATPENPACVDDMIKKYRTDLTEQEQDELLEELAGLAGEMPCFAGVNGISLHEFYDKYMPGLTAAERAELDAKLDKPGEVIPLLPFIEKYSHALSEQGKELFKQLAPDDDQQGEP